MNKEVIMTALDSLTAGRTDDQTLELIEAITNELNTAGEGGEDSTAELDALRAEYEAKLAAWKKHGVTSTGQPSSTVLKRKNRKRKKRKKKKK